MGTPFKLALFPGHTGKDSGAIDGNDAGDNLYTIESVITTGIVSKMALLFTIIGIDHVIAPGHFDARIALTDRCKAGVSIHADVSTDRAVQGFHVIYYPGSVRGKSLAEYIDDSLDIGAHRARNLHARDDLTILKKTKFPCCLVECGFISNAIEEARLYQESYQYNLAFSIVHGVREWQRKVYDG